MEEWPNYYAVIPSEVRYDKDLAPNEKLLYGEITALSNKSGECWASNKYFSELYNVHQNTIPRWLKHLKDKGYIDLDLVYKNDSKTIDKRIIKLARYPINKIVNTYSQNCEYPINKIVKDNNTSINNSNNNSNEDIFEILQKEFGRLLSPFEYEIVRTWLDKDSEIVKQAIKEASLNNQRSVKYIDKILYNWEQANIKTADEAIDYCKRFRNRKKSQQLSRQEQESTGDYYNEL